MELTPLLGISLFQGMKEDELATFLFGSPNSIRLFKAGETIARQGELCKGLYILASGNIRAEMINDEGKELTIEEIKAPSLLASAFIFATENRFPVRVEATEPCEVFLIGKERFLEFMGHYPTMMRNFMKEISDRSVFLSKKLNEFALLNLKERILKYLETHSAIHNQREVAQKLGVTRSSLARALAELTNEAKVHENKIKKEN